ncbi:hypothetical protein [Pelotomaculum propionicicum]|uniref:Uncharacterized protein n=1 Tax=Pelotomaculum propionicicum TaxID=258475 RepID=A0A4Y7RTE3_9FIRM|nr:hypothetical protein [Pelotomaculum propionicicum]NLI12141.1 hypothetical protein [Peptococcaceae bacterium]TEB12030.1 hypothetical protein Pmgp_01186 [Pelotomaculum propionicicum]
MKEGSINKKGPKKSIWALFRDALDEAMEKDSVQHIRKTYDEILDAKEEHGVEQGLFVVSLSEEAQQDPVRQIREIYDKKMEPPVRAGDRPPSKDPFQSVRESYLQLFERKFDQADAENEGEKQDHRPWWKRLF